MSALAKRLVFWAVLAALVVTGLVLAFRPQAVVADLGMVERGELVVSIDDEGETRVHDVYILSMPVTGRLRRIEVHAGDPVVAFSTVVAEIEPIDPSFLDPRSEAQAAADVRAAESAEQLAQAGVEQAEAEFEFADREHERARVLIQEGTISQRELDEAERRFRTSRAALATALAALNVRSFELERARAQLLSPAETRARTDGCDCIPLRAPVDGRILRLLQQSEGVIEAGTSLVEIGDPRDLEVVVDLLSPDAVRVERDMRVIIEGWGGDAPLDGRVRLVEPYGFTKVSALGIEEQRVNVVIDITSPPEDWARLAHGYQVETRIVLSEDDDVLRVPLTALFRDGVDWAVFAYVSGRAELRHVVVGRSNGIWSEIIDGLEAGEQIVLYPSDRILNGTRITGRD